MRMFPFVMPPRHAFSWNQLRRWFALGNIGVLLALGIFAANPSLHGQLHGGHAGTDEGCPITLFASGVTLAVGTIAVLLPAVRWETQPLFAVEPLALESPHFLLQPERGPPLS